MWITCSQWISVDNVDVFPQAFLFSTQKKARLNLSFLDVLTLFNTRTHNYVEKMLKNTHAMSQLIYEKAR